MPSPMLPSLLPRRWFWDLYLLVLERKQKLRHAVRGRGRKEGKEKEPQPESGFANCCSECVRCWLCPPASVHAVRSGSAVSTWTTLSGKRGTLGTEAEGKPRSTVPVSDPVKLLYPSKRSMRSEGSRAAVCWQSRQPGFPEGWWKGTMFNTKKRVCGDTAVARGETQLFHWHRKGWLYNSALLQLQLSTASLDSMTVSYFSGHQG